MSLPHCILQKFDLWDNWDSYSVQLGQYFVSNRIPENKRVAVLLAVVSPPVYRALRDSCYPELPQAKTYVQLSRLLGEHYSPQASVITERVKFHQATQADDETIHEWLARIMSLAVSCEFGRELDSMLRNKFVSGLIDQRIVRRLCEENGMATLRHMVDIAVKSERLLDAQDQEKSLASQQYSMQAERKDKLGNISVCNILDIPDEILRKIILHLEARERVPLGNSCERFNQLVFKDKVLLRDLDFSKNAHLTSEADILPYFEDKSTWKHILKINLRNVQCIEPGHMLNYSIGRANTLVDINVHGIQFKDIRQLGSFLKPLLHVKRLSVDWPHTIEKDINFCCGVLKQPFKRLVYLSVKTLREPWSTEFIRILQLCKVLKELIITKSCFEITPRVHEWIIQPKELRCLEIVNFRGPHSRSFKENFITLLPDPERWIDFRVTMSPSSDPNGFYLEKNIDVCEELLERKVMKSTPKNKSYQLNVGFVLLLDRMLKKVLEITHQNVPKDICCLSAPTEAQPYLLKTDEAKRLLKNLNYQISYLCINHAIRPDCDVHLVASAFPNLNELVLSTVTRNEEPTTNNTHPMKRLRRRDSSIPEKEDDLRNINLDSSFEILIENTPQLRHVALKIQQNNNGEWDLPTLDLIPGWKHLETLHLVFNSLPRHLLLNIDEVSASQCCKNVEWSIQQLLQRCSKLTAFLCEIGCKFESDYDKLSASIKRLNCELRRPNLQIQVFYPRNWSYWTNTILEFRSRPAPRDEFDVDKFFASTRKMPLFDCNRG